MLATWGGGTERLPANPSDQPIEPSVIIAATRREADALRERRRSASSAGRPGMASPSVSPIRMPAVRPELLPERAVASPEPYRPSVVNVVRAAEEVPPTEAELALREDMVNQARMRNAALEGDVPTIDLLLRGSTVGRRPRPPVLPDSFSEDGWSPLMYASLQGHYEAVEVLIKYGADVQHANVLDDTALSLAASVSENATPAEQRDRADVAQLLLDVGAIIDYQNNMGMTALHRAALKGAKVSAVHKSNPHHQLEFPWAPLRDCMRFPGRCESASPTRGAAGDKQQARPLGGRPRGGRLRRPRHHRQGSAQAWPATPRLFHRPRRAVTVPPHRSVEFRCEHHGARSQPPPAGVVYGRPEGTGDRSALWFLWRAFLAADREDRLAPVSTSRDPYHNSICRDVP